MLKYFYILSLVFFIACEGPTGPAGKDGVDGIDGQNGLNGSYDKQVRLYFNGRGSTTSHSWISLQESSNIIKFNKLNYSGVDSIIFVATLSGNSEAQLYNVTDNHPLTNSILSAASSALVWRESSNIMSSFPSYEVTIGVQVRVASGTSPATVDTPMLILYRK